jgi:hypothetical protein
MKQRVGFVSNSSSSSFIVAFPRFPESAEDVQQILFGKEAVFKSPFHDDEGWRTLDVAETVYEDCNKGPINYARMLCLVQRGWFEGCPELPPCDKDEATWRESLRDWEKESLAVAKLLCNKFFKENKGAVILTFKYCDNDSAYYSALEHGDIFRALPHTRISHH